MELKLKRCDPSICQAMCCHDGVYLREGEGELIKKLVKKYPDHFKDLPHKFIVSGDDDADKTQVRFHHYTTHEFPIHFPHTQCVFIDENYHCSLQTLAIKLKMHKWSFKPFACWMFPLKEVASNKVVPSPAEDPEFHACTACGRHREDGEHWQEVLAEELQYHQHRFEKL